MRRTIGTSQTCTLLAIRMGSMDFSRILPTVGTTPLDSPEKYKKNVIIRSDVQSLFVSFRSSTFLSVKFVLKKTTHLFELLKYYREIVHLAILIRISSLPQVIPHFKQSVPYTLSLGIVSGPTPVFVDSLREKEIRNSSS